MASLQESLIMPNYLAMSEKTQVKRHKNRADYDQEKIFAILDDALFGTIAFVEGNTIHAIPMLVWREEEYLYIHGSNGSRLVKMLQLKQQVCVSITHLQGLVLARAAPPHSLNYSSVCIYGVFETVAAENKNEHMKYFFEHWIPGRWQHIRPPNKKDLAATTILRIPIIEAVLKSRQGPPKDSEGDMQQPVWAGVIPLALQWGKPQQVVEQENGDLPGKTVRQF